MAQHFHMPLQSGCDRVLAAMHRWYRAEHYARRVELIRQRLPDAGIGADVIAGFPEKPTRSTRRPWRLSSGCRSAIYMCFRFRSGPARGQQSFRIRFRRAKLKRARELRALGEAKAREFRRSQAGRMLRVLTLRSQLQETTPALSSNYLQVRVPGRFSANEWLVVAMTDVDRSIAETALSPSLSS